VKILLLTFGEDHSFEPPELTGHSFISRKIEYETRNYFPKLKKYAKIAEENECELLAVVPPKTHPEALTALLTAMPDQNIATSAIISFNTADTGRENSTAVTMLQLLTGEKICGYLNDLRIYPTRLLNYLPEKFFTHPLAYLKIVINASRAGYKIVPVEISSGELCISEKPPPPMGFFVSELMKTLLPFLQKRLCPRNFQKEKLKKFLTHPKIFIKYLLKENTTPGALAMAAATGIFIGTLPIFSFHTITIIYISIKLRLNKMLSVNMQHLCIPPFVPIACIEIGHYMLHGEWLKTASLKTLFEEIDYRILEWILGSLILAPINAVVFAAVTYILAKSLQKHNIDS
jgi:uncharacterized protein (DUF2062 family)